MTTDGAPPPGVLRSFGVADVEPTHLSGGEGTSWRAGPLVVKPAADVRFAVWHAELMAALPQSGFRVARPMASSDGTWVAGGWSASMWIPGIHQHRWLDVIAAGRAFHRSLSSIELPAWLHERTDHWAIGNRVAWGEADPPNLNENRRISVERLLSSLEPVELEPQLIHGDLTENVLFDEGLPPAVIDMAPYRRPVGFASAVVVGDAILWFDADVQLAEAVAETTPQFGQLLRRALIYRLVSGGLAGALDIPGGIELAVAVATSLP
jgi:uncharacterized protein (TIGR02569 family)